METFKKAEKRNSGVGAPLNKEIQEALRMSS
jgi:hypothetical protein